MSNELTNIQIEIEKVKLEREKLALARDLKQYQRSEMVAQVSANTASVAGHAIKKTGSSLINLLIFIGFFLLTFFALWLYSTIKDFNLIQGSFGFKLGWYLAQDLWFRLILSLVVAIAGFNVISGTNEADVKSQQKVEFSRSGRIIISSLLSLGGAGMGFLGYNGSNTNYPALIGILSVLFFLSWLIWPKRH